jgi:hypothetical protein
MSETPEQRRRRLRWLTLGEIIAVIAVAISAVGLWKGWDDKRETPVLVEKQVTVPLTLRAEPHGEGKAVSFEPVEPGHAVQSLDIRFPAALGTSAVDGSSDIRLSASYFEDALLGERDKRGAAKEPTGERQLPLLIATRYVENGTVREDRAIYALAYHVREGGLLSDRSLRLGAIRLVARGPGASQAALDRRWASQKL